MKAFIVYCHPSDDSFTRNMRDAFIKGITDSGNEYVLSDLYKMDFKSDITEAEYLRDAYYRNTPEVASDVLEEHKKINSSDVIVFIYPVFWTEAPAKLVGWFDRVWSYGFAYGDKKMKLLDKGLIMCSAGNPMERLEKFGLLNSMKKVMFGDRLINRVKKTEFVVFENTSREKPERESNWDDNLKKAYELGKTIFDKKEEEFSLEDKFFTAIENSESGEVSGDTVFSYHQKGNAIWAEYSGGSIVKGFLLGTMDENHNLHFTYQHINTEGEIKSGACDSKPQIENGKLRFYESWKWTNGEKGTSIIEEI
ncbi:MAG: NAD(P)H-dependent oxidoreductase [Lachnospiraceae bacterium]|nr:NAD(P)H-dependent oxidoreductase [Lachnospiraceae bacterium]